ncbi:MAG: hypothetical protein H6925_04690 [Holosporaceae bacterium]|nr:MAG: hypothetical protein H6925_04690 [Holosporaceae bacterium]
MTFISGKSVVGGLVKPCREAYLSGQHHLVGLHLILWSYYNNKGNHEVIVEVSTDVPSFPFY